MQLHKDPSRCLRMVASTVGGLEHGGPRLNHPVTSCVKLSEWDLELFMCVCARRVHIADFTN